MLLEFLLIDRNLFFKKLKTNRILKSILNYKGIYVNNRRYIDLEKW